MKCDRCNKEIPEKMNYCPSCKVAYNMGHSSYNGKKKSKMKIFVNILLFLMFIGIGYAIYIFVTTAEREYQGDNNYPGNNNQENNNNQDGEEGITLNQIANRVNVLLEGMQNEGHEAADNVFWSLDSFNVNVNNNELIIELIGYTYFGEVAIPFQKAETFISENKVLSIQLPFIESEELTNEDKAQLIFHNLIYDVGVIIGQLNGLSDIEMRIALLSGDLTFERNGIEFILDGDTFHFRADLAREITIN